MYDRAAKREDALDCPRQVGDGEVGEGGGVAGTRPALVDTEAKAVLVDLPPRACLGGPRRQLGAQHTVPETASAIGIVGGELDQWCGHGLEYAAILGLQSR